VHTLARSLTARRMRVVGVIRVRESYEGQGPAVKGLLSKGGHSHVITMGVRDPP